MKIPLTLVAAFIGSITAVSGVFLLIAAEDYEGVGPLVIYAATAITYGLLTIGALLLSWLSPRHWYKSVLMAAGGVLLAVTAAVNQIGNMPTHQSIWALVVTAVAAVVVWYAIKTVVGGALAANNSFKLDGPDGPPT